jgi:hypothetical protein
MLIAITVGAKNRQVENSASRKPRMRQQASKLHSEERWFEILINAVIECSMEEGIPAAVRSRVFSPISQTWSGVYFPPRCVSILKLSFT